MSFKPKQPNEEAFYCLDERQKMILFVINHQGGGL